MKSIKIKIISSVLVMFILSLLLIVGISIVRSSSTIQQVVEYQYTDKLEANNKMLQLYLKEQFGNIKSDNGNLVDSKGKSI